MSTEIMLQKLRSGDCLYVQEWLASLQTRYALRDDQFNSDTLLPLATYELLNHGFCKEDEVLIRVLHAMIDEPDLYDLSGTSSFAIVTLISASLKCLVYLDAGLGNYYQGKAPDISVSAWMHREPPDFDSLANARAVGRKIKALDESIPVCRANIMRKRSCLSLCQRYLTQLQTQGVPGMQRDIRLGVLSALKDMLECSLAMTPELEESMRGFIDSLKKLEPEPWENNILLQLFPPTIADKFRFFAWDLFKSIAGFPDEPAEPKLLDYSTETPSKSV
ncbi:helical bundle domain-containing protein [Legionella sp. CNM-4043-24]|uniref:helical bundle domain-containing protein n=1 Tax=Legionella sp. CNM-4043-24 TaxID=3421646 RepID=UPI00403ACFE4